MIKVLIVDDELLVRVGLVSTIDWEKHGFEVVGQAKNGKEAIQIFESTDPDIVITDIGMPGMDGLELLGYLKDLKPMLKSIILTHHSDFDYARGAIQLGVKHYILKSELGEDNLLTILKELSQNLSPSVSAKGFLSEDDEDHLVTCLRDKVLLSCPPDLLDKLNQKFTHDYFSIVYTRIFSAAKEDQPNMDRLQVKKILQNLLSQNTTGNALRYQALPLDNTLVLILNYDFNQYEHIEKHLQNVSHHLHKFLNLNTTFGISSPSLDFSALPQLFVEAQKAEQRSFFDSRGIFVYPRMDSVGTDFLTMELTGLRRYILNGLEKDMAEYLGRLFAQIERRKNYDQCKDMFQQLMKTVINIQQSYNLKPTEYRLYPFENFYNFTEMKDYLFLIFKTLQKNMVEQNNDSHSFIISKSLEYIEDHYSHSISLGDIAEKLQISPSYLSHLFKQEMSINFSTYLNQFRIKKSKELLANSHLKVYEIAGLVGFENPYYFSKVFKEFTKMTCKEYRNG